MPDRLATLVVTTYTGRKIKLTGSDAVHARDHIKSGKAAPIYTETTKGYEVMIRPERIEIYTYAPPRTEGQDDER